MSSPALVALQTSAPPWEDIFLWSGILLGAVLAGVIVMAVLRRLLTGRTSVPNEGFTLHELRELHASGRMTDSEYQRAKAAIIARSKAPPPGEEEDPAARAVRELKERRRPAKPGSRPPADKPAGEDATDALKSQDGPPDSV